MKVSASYIHGSAATKARTRLAGRTIKKKTAAGYRKKCKEASPYPQKPGTCHVLWIFLTLLLLDLSVHLHLIPLCQLSSHSVCHYSQNA